jgi:hypothetical protein
MVPHLPKRHTVEVNLHEFLTRRPNLQVDGQHLAVAGEGAKVPVVNEVVPKIYDYAPVTTPLIMLERESLGFRSGEDSSRGLLGCDTV